MTATALRLYECVDGIDTVREWIDEHADELIAAGGDLERLPELAELLELAEGQLANKVESVALYVRELLSTAAAIKEESARLAARAKHAEAAAASLKRYLLINMERAELKRVDGKLVTVRVQASPPAVTHDLTDADLRALYAIPVGPRFVTRTETFALDRKVTLAAEQTGESLPPGVQVTRGTHIRIA